jgi:uncharacterized OB-fold protein
VRAWTLEDPLLQRAVPAPDPLSDFFWTSGADGELRILRCLSCGFYLQPPSVPCQRCLGAEVVPTVVSGTGVVAACTVNVQQWTPGQPPYAIAIVELDEQRGLRLTSNVVGCDPDDVRIGQAVEVRFIHRNDVYYPVFTPTDQAGR